MLRFDQPPAEISDMNAGISQRQHCSWIDRMRLTEERKQSKAKEEEICREQFWIWLSEMIETKAS